MFAAQYVSPPVLVSVLVLVLTWFLLSYCKRQNHNLPPGPWGLPLFGYYLFLSTKPYLDFKNLAERYGSVLSFRTVGGKLFVVLSGAKTIKDVLVHRAEEFIGRPQEHNLLEWISEGLGVTQEEGSSWKEHRRFFLQSVKNFGFGKKECEEPIHEQVEILLDDVRKTKGKSTDFSFHVAFAVNSIISQIMFNKKFGKYDATFSKLAKGLHDLIDIFADNRFMLVGYFYEYIAMKMFPSSAKVRRGRAILRNIIDSIIADHVKTFDPNNLRDYVDTYLYQIHKLEKSGELEKSTFTMKRLRAISMNMMMEGTESVTSAICCLLKGASKYPEEQKKVQDELDAVVSRNRRPSWSDRQELRYLDVFIQELYRTFMPFYISTHYSNFEETTINGYRIPRRTILVANLWTINNDPEIYPDPKRFDPSRFLDKDGKRVKSEGPYPFGIGKRACVGESLAQMEVFLILSSVFQNFTLYPGEAEDTIKAIPRD